MENTELKPVVRQGRRPEYELLRILCVFFAIFAHVSVRFAKMGDLVIGTTNWIMADIYASVPHCIVPLFVMLSGAFLMDQSRELTFADCMKRVKKLAICFVTWSVIINAFDITNRILRYDREFTAGEIVRKFFFPTTNMWFMYLFMGIYLAAPFLKRICADRQLEKLYLKIWFFATVIVTTLRFIPAYEEHVMLFEKYSSLTLFMGYSGYFVLGNVIMRSNIPLKVEIPLYIAGLLSAAAVPTISFFLSTAHGVHLAFNDNLTIFMFTWAVAVFTFFTKRVRIKHGVKPILKIAECTLGILLAHTLIQKVVILALGAANWENNIIGTPVVTAVIFVSGLAGVYVMRKFKWFRKYFS